MSESEKNNEKIRVKCYKTRTIQKTIPSVHKGTHGRKTENVEPLTAQSAGGFHLGGGFENAGNFASESQLKQGCWHRSNFESCAASQLLFSVRSWQDLIKRFKCSSKFTLTIIADSLCNFGYGHICFFQHLCSLPHAVFFDVRGKGSPVNRLKSIF